MANTYVNKVQKSDGTVLIDITDTTALAADVNSGKYLHLADGSRVQGTQVLHSVSTSLTNVTASAVPSKVLNGGQLYCELTPANGYVISSVSVTMGNVDITDQAFVEPLDTKTITQNGTYTASADHLSGYSSVTVAVAGGGSSPTLQTKSVSITPSTSAQSQTVTADSGYDGMDEVDITVSAIPTGTAGTPTATKGTVSNHSISVTPSVTNTAGYIASGTKTGTAVTVSAAELVSGSETKTANGTYDVTNLAELVVNVSSSGSSMNVQIAQSTSRASSSTYTNLVSLTCSKAGTYDIYWDCFRSSTSGTSGSQLYIGGSEYGTANTTFTNHAQTNHLTGVTLAANQTVAVYARSRGNSYYAYVGTLVIKQTA